MTWQKQQVRKRAEIADWIESGVRKVEVLGGNFDEGPTECSTCLPFEGKRFPIDQAPVTPFHEGCRCETSALL